ncbi:hypothetical protein D3C79_700590 [compost metagenome]
MRRVAEQVGNTEIHAPTPAEHFLAYRAVVGVGVTLGMLFGKFDAHLHRPAGVHRVEPAQQGLAQWQAGNDFIEQCTQLLLAAYRK